MTSTPTTGSRAAFCSACGTRLSDGARFCHECGAPAGAQAVTSARSGSASNLLPWSVAALALVAVVALLAGQSIGRRSVDGGAGAVATGPAPGSPPDISSMSPQERADRLFDRVMRYASAGQTDSAQLFAPMAISATEALGPLTAHLRYDIGLIALASGDQVRAQSEADVILNEQPTHLLGLVLSARIADAKGDVPSRTKFERKLLASEAAERNRNLPEYTDHGNDLNAALDVARGRSK